MFRFFVTICLSTLLVQQSFACRYTVRDIGFVDLQGPTYTLWLVDGNATLAGKARKWLGHCNVTVAVIDRSERDHPVLQVLPSEVGEDSLCVVLENSERMLLYIGSAEKGGEKLKPLVESVVTSPARNTIRTKALDTFGFIVAFDAPPQILRAAEQRLKAYESQLPRSIDHPVVTIELDAKQKAAEKVLLWSLGMMAEEPSAVVMYGRGKRVGAPLQGDKLTDESLAMQLAFVGESCECETDRNWVEEPVAPVRWGASEWERTRTLLGFDPESPLVKAEVTRIIRKGIRPGEKKQTSEDLSSVLLGYREVEIPASENREVRTDVQPQAHSEMLSTNESSVVESQTSESLVASNQDAEAESISTANSNSNHDEANNDKSIESTSENGADNIAWAALGTVGVLAALSIGGACVLFARRQGSR